MEDPFPMYLNPPPQNPNSSQNHDHHLPIPPLDLDFLAGDLSFSGEFSGDCVDFDFIFDDFDIDDDLAFGHPQSDVSHDQNPNSDGNPTIDVSRVFDSSNQGSISSEESNFVGNFNCTLSNSGVSLDSGNNSDRDVSSSNNNNNNNNFCKNEYCGSNVKEGNDKDCLTKRKQEQEHELGESSDEVRVKKIRRSSTSKVEEESGEDGKRKARLLRNRESAQLSRQRKKQYVEELEDKVRSMRTTITDLNTRISYVMAENAALRQQLSGGAGVCPPPSMYPMGMAPMPYPWMACPPYMVKPQGTQVPLVPIPRLKPQQLTSASKVDKNKKVESKKKEGKSKKVASISLLGLLFFFLLFGGLVPMVNVSYGGVGEGVRKGTVLMVDNHVGKMGFKGNHGRVLQQCNKSDEFGSMGNSSEPLTASLYVPRNDKLVKIDGNLIIHSVLASERAVASNTDSKVKTGEETSLAVVRRYPPYPVPELGRNDGIHSHGNGNSNGMQRAIASSYSEESQSVRSDRKLQQWFREGLAGPMLSSGMCTEVFQFDISPTPGSIVPAKLISNSTTTTTTQRQSQNSTKPINRRILEERSIPLDSSALNFTKEHGPPHKQNEGLNSNSSHQSSMVVSVLVDPREAGDGDGEGVIRSNTLSRIFVVVLIDSVKYVTYSCMLPFVGSGNQHLVTT